MDIHSLVERASSAVVISTLQHVRIGNSSLNSFQVIGARLAVQVV